MIVHYNRFGEFEQFELLDTSGVHRLYDKKSLLELLKNNARIHVSTLKSERLPLQELVATIPFFDEPDRTFIKATLLKEPVSTKNTETLNPDFFAQLYCYYTIGDDDAAIDAKKYFRDTLIKTVVISDGALHDESCSFIKKLQSIQDFEAQYGNDILCWFAKVEDSFFKFHQHQQKNSTTKTGN